MDPNHRDRVAFVRVCSGRFARGMEVNHVRTGRPFTMSRTMQFLAQERITIDEAYAGDILGVWDGGSLRIGDTLAERASFEFEGVPRFSPEHFVQVTLKDPLKRKQLKKGLEQLSEEGAVQLFYDRHRLERDPILGAVGVLQFEVIEHRLEAEYKVSIHLRHPAVQVRALDRRRALRARADRARPGRELRPRRRIPADRAVRERLGPAKGDRGPPAPALPGGRAARPRRHASMRWRGETRKIGLARRFVW